MFYFTMYERFFVKNSSDETDNVNFNHVIYE